MSKAQRPHAGDSDERRFTRTDAEHTTADGWVKDARITMRDRRRGRSNQPMSGATLAALGVDHLLDLGGAHVLTFSCTAANPLATPRSRRRNPLSSESTSSYRAVSFRELNPATGRNQALVGDLRPADGHSLFAVSRSLQPR